jgi:CheY-like chemotaxis protein
MCASLGISVTVASNGEEAIAAVRGCGGSGRADTGGATSPTAPPFFDVILMDMSMPGVNGCDAARALRAQGCATPIVAMTANASDADRDACMAAGMDGFLSKPVLRDRLAEALLLVLTGRARFQDSDTFAAGFLAAPRA